MESPSRVAAATPYDALWVGYPLPSVVGALNALLPYGGGIVAGGTATAFGTTTASRVALWDGVAWQAMGSGPSMSSVNALTTSGGLLVAGGNGGGSGVAGERPAVSTWDGFGWATVGNANGSVNVVCTMGSDLYVGGTFTSVNGVPAERIARWDGASWHAVGAGFPGPVSSVSALVVHGASLVAGGSLGSIQGVAGWDGASWSQLGAGLNGSVTALASDGVTLLAGGAFTMSGGTPITRLAAWNGSTWTGYTGANADSRALAFHGGQPMATLLVGGLRRPHLWDGFAWQGYNQPNVEPYSYATDGGTLFVAGGAANPTVPAPLTLGGFYGFDGAAWTHVQQAWTPDMRGLSGFGECAVVHQGALYVGGGFRFAGAGSHFESSPWVARWDGADWSVVGAPAPIYDLAVWSDSLVANAGGYTVDIWNGSSWRRLAPTPTGSFDNVWSLASHQGSLYAFGGEQADNVDVHGVARWNGSAWEAVGGGVDDPWGVWCGASWGAHLVVAGGFAMAGGAPARNIAYWDGSSYHAMGTGVNADVASVVEFEGDLVAGGGIAFTEAGGVPVSGVARFDGSDWHAMGSRALGINKLAVHGGRLYAAGRFLDDLDEPAMGVAVWRDSDWVLLGTHASSTQKAHELAFFGDDLHIVGDFLDVAGHPARNFARLPNVSTLAVPGPGAPSRLALAPSPNPSRGGVRFAVTLPSAGRVRLVVHDVTGREVARLLDGAHEAGTFSLAWSARVAPGLYFATLEAVDGRTTTRVVRLE